MPDAWSRISEASRQGGTHRAIGEGLRAPNARAAHAFVPGRALADHLAG